MSNLKKIETPFTKLMGIDYPIVMAPMFLVSNTSMIVEALNSGITAAFPAGKIGTTLENLKASAEGEHYEQAEMYPEFAKTAHEEGFDAISRVFEAIAVAELQHERRYAKLAKNLEEGKVFKKDGRLMSLF